MVGINFDRPVGPYADSKELEYISALQQTCVPTVRQDGSIEAKDIMHFLRSRHGIQVDEDFVRDTIIMELCGSPALKPAEKKTDEDASGALALKDADESSGSKSESKDAAAEGEEEEDPEPIMDICQMLTLLLIPFLRSGNTDGTDQESVSRVLDLALDTIWAELRSHSIDVQGSENGEGVLVTPDFLAEMLDIFGEFNVPPEVLHEMIAAASGDANQEDNKPQFYLTKASFLQALTADTQLFDPNLDQVKSTHYNDARKISASKSSLEGQADDNADGQEKELPYKEMYMASHIDNTADNYRSTAWYALSWVAAVFVYLMYFTQTTLKITEAEMNEWGCGCPKDDPACSEIWGCDLARALLNWTIIFLELMILGFVWLFISNLGNANQPTETISQKLFTTIRVALAMFIVVAATQLTFFCGWNAIDNPDPDYADEQCNWGWINMSWGDNQLYFTGYFLAMAVGLLILLVQLFRVVGMFAPFGPCTKGGAEFKEQKTKNAATNKITQLVEHASLLHVPNTDVKKSFTASLSQSTVSQTVIDLSKKLHDSTVSPRSSNRVTGSSTAKVLMNYSHMHDTTETIGGVSWAWKKIINGSLFKEEGIYLHGRLIAVNVVQFLVVFILLGMFVQIFFLLETVIDPDDGCDLRINGLIVNDGNTTEDVITDEVTDEFDRFLQEGNASFAAGLEEAIANNDTLGFLNDTVGDTLDFLNDTAGAFFGFVEGFINFIDENAGEEAGFDEWSLGDWNINSTHFFDGFHIVEYEEGSDRLLPWNELAEVYNISTVCYDLYISNGTAVWVNEVATYKEFIDALELEPWMYKLCSSVGFLVAVAAALTISFVYVPSYVSSVLKLRSGYDPSLKGNYLLFLMFRKSPDQCGILWGSAFWGILFSSGLAFAIFGGLTFILVWPLTRPYVKTAIANYIGIMVTMTLKIILMMSLRKCLFAGGFYRRRPASANMWSVVFEAQSLGTSIGTVTTRTLKLFFITIFFIGRIDTPMLAPGVGYVKGTPMDPAPNAFRKDLLIHEAHRHPYIERLGLLYLLKIFNRESFGTRAGAYWRLLFTLALLPWMRKYRVSRGVPVSADNESDDPMDSKMKAMEETEDAAMDLPPPAHVWDRNDDIKTLAAKRRHLKNQLKELNTFLSEKLNDPGDSALTDFDRAQLMESQRGTFSTASGLSC